jgi:phage baseplate assembly protein W
MVKTYYFDFSKRGQDLLGNRDIAVIKDEQAIKEAVYNILNTRIGSVPMHPERGINIDRFLFEPIDDITASILEYEVEKGLLSFENRLQGLQVKVTPSADNNSFLIDIAFSVNFTSNPIYIQLDFAKIR